VRSTWQIWINRHQNCREEKGKEVNMTGVYSKNNRPIHVVDYDPNWPRLFEQEKALLLATLGKGILQIEHFGSTSIPGLAAKPVIDIAVGVKTFEETIHYVPLFESLGYIYEPEFEAAIPTRRFFWKGTPLVHTYHIHLAAVGSEAWIKPILFRDYLRAHPDEARQYQELKRALAAQHISDMDGYIDGKTAFVASIVSKAEAQK
jgi:GrpB-like predicted nucleotidyltransferase (UPF0157 family)